MALQKLTETGEISVGANSVISVRTDTVIQDDGNEISRSFHRHVIAPTDDISGEDARVQAVANSLWTDEVKAAYTASLPAEEPAAEPAAEESSEE
jgi:phage FluMu gp28-like protein